MEYNYCIKNGMDKTDIETLMMKYYDEQIMEEDFYTEDIKYLEEPQYVSTGTSSLYENISKIFKTYNISDYFLDNFAYFKNTKTIHETFKYGYTFHTLKEYQFHQIIQDIYDFSLTLKLT